MALAASWGPVAAWIPNARSKHKILGTVMESLLECSQEKTVLARQGQMWTEPMAQNCTGVSSGPGGDKAGLLSRGMNGKETP